MLRTSSRPAIRREALRAIAAHFPGEREALREALLDPSFSVRMTACYLVREHFPDFDVAEHYRTQLRSGDAAARATACGGLGDFGTRDDCALLLNSYRESESLRVRKEALRAIARLDAEVHAELLRDALLSPIRGLSRTAALALQSSGTAVPGICAAATDHALPHVRLHALRLLMRVDKWSRLLTLLRAARDADARVQRDAMNRIGTWFWDVNKSFVTPSPEQLVELREELDASAPCLSEGQRRLLRFVLESGQA